MDDRCVASKLRLERFARRLPRQNSYERAKHIVACRINRHGCSATNDWRNTSSSLASFASSFGHDTPAHVERRLAIRGVRDGDEWAALSAAPNASRLASSAEGVFGAAIARRHSQRDLIKRSESGTVGTRLSSVIPKRSTSDDVEGVPCGTSEMFRTYASSRVLSTAIKPRPSHKCQIKRSAGGVNARRPCGTHGRSVSGER